MPDLFYTKYNLSKPKPEAHALMQRRDYGSKTRIHFIQNGKEQLYSMTYSTICSHVSLIVKVSNKTEYDN
jgi:hypothetical protein